MTQTWRKSVSNTLDKITLKTQRDHLGDLARIEARTFWTAQQEKWHDQHVELQEWLDVAQRHVANQPSPIYKSLNHVLNTLEEIEEHIFVAPTPQSPWRKNHVQNSLYFPLQPAPSVIEPERKMNPKLVQAHLYQALQQQIAQTMTHTVNKTVYRYPVLGLLNLKQRYPAPAEPVVSALPPIKDMVSDAKDLVSDALKPLKKASGDLQERTDKVKRSAERLLGQRTTDRVWTTQFPEDESF